MSQKIGVISFDHWNYDQHIISALEKKGIDSFHIKIGAFKHKTIFHRIVNSLSKAFLGKNPKLKKRQDFIIETLQKKGHQDQILVINPELIDKEYHLKIKSFTNKYIAYLYDSVDRNPIQHLLKENIFDEIYSFDKDDIKKYHFKETTNYNYIEKIEVNQSKIIYDVLYIASFDNRIQKIMDLAKLFSSINVSFKPIIIGKKTTLFRFKKLFKKELNILDLRRKRISQNQLLEHYKQSKIILDLVRDNQSGLSFRIFEAMALEKKIITNNLNIKNYDFYNANNILVLEDDSLENIDRLFFETKYESLPINIYKKYTLSNWVSTVFNLSQGPII